MTALVLFAGTLLWASDQRSSTQRRERDQLFRYTESLAKGLSVVVEKIDEGQTGADDQIRRAISQKLRLRWPFRFVALVRDREVIAQEGSAPDDAHLRPGMHDDGVFVVRVGLAGRLSAGVDRPPSKPGRPRKALPWDWTPSEAHAPLPQSLASLDLVAGFDPSVNPGALREALFRVLATLVIAWAAIAALLWAWVRSIRSRDLQAALDNERRERSRLAEMSLAAAGLAHETKNPLGLILGLAQRLNADAATPPAAKEVAEQIMDAADRASARLSDFINFARLPTPRMHDGSASELLGRVAMALKADFDEAGVRLTWFAEDFQLRCDPGMFEQVLVNLLLNSLQASAAGSTTTVRLDRKGAAAALSVMDQGRGIAPPLLPEIFKPYVTGRPEGHGLGLAIVRRIADQHGWQIAVDSVLGRGTTFTLTGLLVVPGKETPP